MSYRVEAAIN